MCERERIRWAMKIVWMSYRTSAFAFAERIFTSLSVCVAFETQTHTINLKRNCSIATDTRAYRHNVCRRSVHTVLSAHQMVTCMPCTSNVRPTEQWEMQRYTRRASILFARGERLCRQRVSVLQLTHSQTLCTHSPIVEHKLQIINNKRMTMSARCVRLMGLLRLLYQLIKCFMSICVPLWVVARTKRKNLWSMTYINSRSAVVTAATECDKKKENKIHNLRDENYRRQSATAIIILWPAIYTLPSPSDHWLLSRQ